MLITFGLKTFTTLYPKCNLTAKLSSEMPKRIETAGAQNEILNESEPKRLVLFGN